jgi:hypothetical protein
VQPSLFVWGETHGRKWLPPGPPTFMNQNIHINEDDTDQENAFIQLGEAYIKTIQVIDASMQMLADQLHDHE